MENNVMLFLGILVGYLIVAIPKSIYSPETRWIQAIKLFGQPYAVIANVEGKYVNKDKNSSVYELWELVDLPQGQMRRINIYFFLWPFFKLHTFPFSYEKEIAIGEEQEGDIIIFKNEKTKKCIISRRGISNHLEWRVEYPTVTSDLETKELGQVDTFTNNMLEVVRPRRTFFGIKNWLKAAEDTLHGGLRGIVASKQLFDLNKLHTEEKDEFNYEMQKHANSETTASGQPGLPAFGLYLFRSVFKDFSPANEKTKMMMESYVNVTIAEEQGKANVIAAKKAADVSREKATGEADALRTKAQGEADATRTKAKGEADAYETNQEKIVHWRKKYLIDTGLAKTDRKGQIIELVPDANIKVGTEAIKKLSEITGTLVLDSSSLNKIFSINSTKQEEK